jgi:tRNA dimethylallyltransferase
MQNSPLSQLALIGPTASGKSALALELAETFDGIILSLDSLALYREIDIASAKPTPEERGTIPHHGIDLIDPDQPFDVMHFARLYREAAREAIRKRRPLFIVGGSSFYLKTLLNGISPLPPISPAVRREVDNLLRDPKRARARLEQEAPDFAKRIAASDTYRTEKALLILLQTGMDPVDYFRRHPPVPVIDTPLPIFEIIRAREQLRKRIVRRTDTMLHNGLIDEVSGLEFRYGRAPNAMKAIGIVEVLAYLDGRYSRKEMREKIITHTARLAKRQTTFNRSQFIEVSRGEKEELKAEIVSLLRRQV